MRRCLGFLVPLFVATVVALSGCSDDSPGEVDDEPSEQSTTPSADPTDTDEPTETSSPTVPPATGGLLELSNVSVRVPEGFQPDPPALSYLRFAFEQGGIQSIALGNTPAVNEDLSLREQARISIRNNVYSQQPSIQDPVEIGGITMYHYAGQISDNEYVVEYGAIHEGSQVSVNFRLAATSSDAERQQLVDSVMATLAFS